MTNESIYVDEMNNISIVLSIGHLLLQLFKNRVKISK